MYLTTPTKFKSAARAAFRIAPFCVCLTGAALAEPSRSLIELAYEPSSREVTLTLPSVTDTAAAELRAPAWLTRDPSPDGTGTRQEGAVFVGILPEIEAAEPGLGAGDSGAFLFGSFEWLPQPPDGTPAELRIRTPLSHRGVATGELISESTTDEGYAAVFRLTDGWRQADIFFGPYQIAERLVDLPAGQVTVRTYFKPAEQDYSQNYLDAAGDYISRYSSEIGPYPYPGFAVVSAPIPVGYAFDGLTYVSEQILGHPYMLGRSLAHEVLHGWWGSGVRIDHDTGNWAEGLTTYQADYALAMERGPDAAKEMRREWLAALSSLPPSADRPLRDFRSSAHDRDQSVGYGKSAMVFHMLRQRLGERDFAAGLSRFWDDNQGRTAGWADLRRAFEVTSGRDLSGFFTQWLDRPGLPEIAVDGVDAEVIAAGYSVSVRIRQSGESYAIEIPVTIETATGERTETVFLDESIATFVLPVADRPLSVSVDPDFQMLRALAEGELPPTLRDVLRAEDMAVVVGSGADAAADSLTSALFREPGGLRRVEAGTTIPSVEALIAVGTTEEIASLRADHFADEPPEVAREGTTRAWVEEDGKNRLWLFVSSETPDAMPGELAILRYYTSQSFVTLEPGARAISGRWPVLGSPLRVQLE